MIVAQGAWGSDVPLFPPEIWQWGPWVGLLFVALLLGVPILRARMEARDKADQERRERADKADQERRDRADQERREQAALLLSYLQTAVANGERRLDAQTKEFLAELARHDKQFEEQLRDVTAALRGLTSAVESLQRRQRS